MCVACVRACCWCRCRECGQVLKCLRRKKGGISGRPDKERECGAAQKKQDKGRETARQRRRMKKKEHTTRRRFFSLHCFFVSSLLLRLLAPPLAFTRLHFHSFFPGPLCSTSSFVESTTAAASPTTCGSTPSSVSVATKWPATASKCSSLSASAACAGPIALPL